METTLLATKLFVPTARPGLVPRPRLVERLNAALTSGLVLISAPAGFGKTTAVVQWILQSGKDTPFAWVSLDDGDNDPIRFWDYLIAALRTLRPATGDAALNMLHSTQKYATESILTSLINDVTEIARRFVVVLDDYHLVKSDAIHAGLAFFLGHLPPRMHLVIATRADPPLPLPHFRGRGALVEVGADDLRFTQEEATRLMREMLGKTLSAEQIASLNAHTEGWVVGLKMAALSMRGEKDVQTLVSGFTGSQRYVMDYLLEEVLKRQTGDVRSFLLSTSILEKMTGPLCDFLTEGTGGANMLIELDRANLFLVSLDDSRQWYRYHHLFAELLCHQLETAYGVDEATRLHQLASQWYEDNSFPDDAIHHAMAARDWERAMRLVSTVADQRMSRGEILTLVDWFKSIPETSLTMDPKLYCLFANALVTVGDFEVAEQALKRLESMAEQGPRLQGYIALLRASIAWSQGDIPKTFELSTRALSLLPPENLRERSQANWFLGRIQWQNGSPDEAELYLTQAYKSALQSGDGWSAHAALAFLGALRAERGKLRSAADLLREAIDLNAESPSSAMPRCSISYILYEWNDLDGAEYQQEQAIRLGVLSGYDEVISVTLCQLALTRLAQGDATEVVAAMEKAGRLAGNPGISPPFHAHHAAIAFLIAIHQADPEAEAKWLAKVEEYADAMPSFLWYIPSRALIAAGQKTDAARRLEEVYEKAVRANMLWPLVRCRVCQALAAPTDSEALRFLEEALIKGEPEGYIRTFVDEGKLLKPLLRKAMAKGVTPEYTAKLLKIIEADEELRSTRGKAAASGSTAPRLLSERELEVLRLVADGLSNKQIADKLIISLATAKTHVAHLFAKLAAKDRLQAVKRARELKLI